MPSTGLALWCALAALAPPPLVAEPGWIAELVAAPQLVNDPVAAAGDIDGGLWIIDRGASTALVRVAPGGLATTLLDGLLSVGDVLPLDGRRALLLEPPNLHLVTIGVDGSASTKVVASGLGASEGRSLGLAADGTIAITGVPARLRWRDGAVVGAPAPMLPGIATAEHPDGSLLAADGAWLGRVEHAWPAPAGAARPRSAPLSSVAVASAEVLSIVATRDGLVVSTLGGAIESPRAAGERWGRVDAAVATPIARAEPPTRRLMLGSAADGAFLVAVGASSPGAGDGAVMRLVRADRAIAPWPVRDERMSDRVARIADPDPARRAAAREAMVAALADGPAGREELAVAARAIARSHRDPAIRREAMHLLVRLDRLTTADLDGAASDPDRAVRRDAIRIAGTLERRDLLLAACDDADPAVRVEARLALVVAAQPPAEILAIVDAIAGDRRDDAALLALRAAAWGREIEVLEALPADASPSMARSLVDAMLERAAPSTRRELLERALDGRMSAVAAQATLERMVASAGEFDRRPRRLPLDREPKGLATTGPQAQLVARLEPHLRWPGRPGIVEDAIGVDELRAEGRLLYAQCAVCHGPAGLGQTGVYPSLAGSAIANGPPERFAKVLLHGLAGGRTAAGRPYAAQMPKAVVSSDEELAAIMTYVRSAFGNAAEPIDPALVSRVREAHRDRTAPWSAEELGRP